jgi:hypothetical protein
MLVLHFAATPIIYTHLQLEEEIRVIFLTNLNNHDGEW